MVKKCACTSVKFVSLRSATPFRMSFPYFMKLCTPSRFFIGGIVHGVSCVSFKGLTFLLIRWFPISCLSIIIYHCVKG